jgi:replicative DNA helicase
MTIGLGLLEKMIMENRPLSFLEEHGLPESAFKGDESRVFEFVADHILSHGRMPKIKTVEQEVNVKMSEFPDEPIGYWVDGLKDRYTTGVLLDGYEEVRTRVIDGDTEGAVEALQLIAISMGSKISGNQISKLADVLPSVIKQHDERQRSALMKGIPFGLPYLDEMSDGAQQGDTVAFVGRPGVGKSYIMGMMSLYSYIHHGDVPLVVTMEMLSDQWARRTLSMSSSVTAHLMRLGQLSKWGRDRMVAGSNELVEMTERPYYILQGTLGSTIEDLAMRVQELKPTVVYIDGAYLMQTKNKHTSKWERVAELAEYQKMLARDFRLPVIASWQFNRKGPSSLGNIGFSDVIGQLASIVCGIRDEGGRRDDWNLRSYKLLDLLKGREGEKGTIRVLYDMGRMVIEQDSVVYGRGGAPDEDDDYDD